MTTHERLIELVPDIVKCTSCNGQGWTAEHGNYHDPETGECEGCPIQVQCEDCFATGRIEDYTITLADVLVAVHKHAGHIGWLHARSDGMIGVLERGDEYHSFKEGGVYWDLKLPFHLQPQETQDFIGRILGVDK